MSIAINQRVIRTNVRCSLCVRVYHCQDRIARNSLYSEAGTEKEIGNNSNTIFQVMALYSFLLSWRKRTSFLINAANSLCSPNLDAGVNEDGTC